MADASGENSIQYVSRDDKNTKIECFTRENYSKELMVWAGISKNGKTRLYFVNLGVKINNQYYIYHILKPGDARRLYPDGDYIFHQDAAFAHVSKLTTEFMESRMKFLKKTETMLKSPDAAPMDYFVWGWMRKAMNHIIVSNINDLKKALRRVWGRLPQKMINRALESWQNFFYQIYKARGNHIEQEK